jgi:hypothetical protein
LAGGARLGLQRLATFRERLVIRMSSRGWGFLRLGRQFFHIGHIFARHLLRWDLNNHTIDLVQPQFTTRKSQKSGFDPELA